LVVGGGCVPTPVGDARLRHEFSIYLPEQTPKTDMPVLYWLSGPTCTEQNFTGKLAHSGMQRNMV